MDYIPAKHLLHRNKSTEWFGTDHTMNIYRGCCHGCLYCDSRSSCYQNPNFDQVKAKADALRILRDDLARKAKPAFITMGSMSDPYNPFERELQLTRHALELIDAYQCGVAAATKSDLIARDVELYQIIQAHSPVICKLTVTTVDDALAAKLEPRAPLPSRRLKALEALSKAGVFSGVLLMPVLPFLEDSAENVLAVVDSAAQAGARFVYAAFGVTMRDGQRDYFLNGLDQAFPGRGMGERYRKKYGSRYSCASPRARELWELFSQRCQKLGLLYQMKHIISAAVGSYGDRQLTFFDLVQ
ncbi:radical SAM protein [Pseudoflavonifractor sp. 60]|uniref:SPL family radical SAM protein n=1 Tax=Pseudoflavonifractor sp. 60 TaxID=2304576 RepID=UPI00136F0596|nr:radical SAM protein [Pseudoflavonifractor sp. 60]NBI68037.1 radical SAM protein [Pseudoflavonifractor sp. 60]